MIKIVTSSSQDGSVAVHVDYNSAREKLAEVIHNSRFGVLRWDYLPESPRNPSRYYARTAADEVLKNFIVTEKEH